MKPQCGILLISKEQTTVHTVSSVLDSSSHLVASGVCQHISDIPVCLEANNTAAVLVDIDPNPAELLKDLTPVVARFPDKRFLILCSSLQNHLILQAMRIGARHFLHKDNIRSELITAIESLIPRDANQTTQQGDVISVLSASGGCGATTLAVNLASEIGLRSSSPALLIDLDISYGAIATYLGIKSQYGIADVLARQGQIDQQLIVSSAYRYSDNLDVLVSPVSVNPSQPQPLQLQCLAESIEACKQSYRYIVIDAPHLPIDVAAPLALMSHITLIIFQLVVKDIKTVNALKSSLLSKGVAPEKILPVANRSKNKKHMVSIQDCEKALSPSRLEHIGNDFKAAVQSLNHCQPLAKTAPRSALRQDIYELLRKVLMNDLHHKREETK